MKNKFPFVGCIHSSLLLICEIMYCYIFYLSHNIACLGVLHKNNNNLHKLQIQLHMKINIYTKKDKQTNQQTSR